MRKILLMALIALGILVLLAILWQYIGPSYNSLIAISARPFIAPNISTQSESMEIALSYAGAQPGAAYKLGIRSLTLYYGSLLVISLILATIVCTWRRRIAAAVSAFIVFYIVAVGTVVVMSWGFKWTLEGGIITLNALGPIMTFSYIGFPALLSAFWCVKYWLPLGLKSNSMPSKVNNTRQRKKTS